MKMILTTSALATAVVVGGVLFATPSIAQDNQPCVGENCPAPDMQGDKKRMKGVDQDSQGTEDQTPMRKKRIQGSTDEGEMQDGQMPRKKKIQQSKDVDVDVDVNVGSRTSSRGEWRYEPGKHRRSKSKSATFRFFYNGYYYPQPYWTEVYVVGPGRISCGEGRAIVATRFNRVRVVECRGGIYTYLGRRQGDTFRILVNSRSGRIVGRTVI